MRTLGFAVALAAVVAAPCVAQSVAFVDVDVVPLDRERVLQRQTVVVTGDRITALGPSSSTPVPAGATRIDGRGKYLMPGLAEMHAHVIGGNNPNHEQLNRDILFLYVANGITSIRAMLGAPNQIPLREQLKRGEIPGPTMYVSAPSLNGQSAPTPDSGARLVRAHKAAGYDFLKIHPGLSLETYDAIARTANEVELSWAGHVPAAVGLRHALASGQSGVDHLDGMLEAAMPDSLYERLRSGASVPFEEQVNAVDPSRFAAVAAEIKAARSWQVPTILVWENLFSETNTIEEMAAWPELRFVSPQARANYATQKRNLQQNLRNTGATPELSAKYVDLRRRAVKALIDADVPLLMGTDSPQLFMVPGFALHRELAIIASLGVSPFRLYESGSKNVARYVAEKLGQDGRFGTVAVGNRADLVLLDANPLASVENLKRRAGVMVRGRWVSSEEIDRGLAQLAARHAP